MSSENHAKKRDWLRWPANLILWAAVGWIAYNVATALLARRELVAEINQATTLCRRSPRRAEKILNKARMNVLSLRRTPGERFLTAIGLPFPNVDSQAAGVYKALGDFHSARYDHVSTIRSYAMCLAHDPKSRNFAIDLGGSCMQMDNFELGYFVGELANREKPGRGDIYFRFFGKHYSPDWTKGPTR